MFACESAILAHERLAIVDVEHGAQPLVSADGALVLAVNGEIYNHRTLEAGLERPYPFRTRSDCEVILPLYEQRGVAFLNDLNGIFAFALYDRRRNRYVIARDPIGVMPLYIGHDAHGQCFVASEMKALVDVCPTFRAFPPGHVFDSATGRFEQYYQPAWRDYDATRGTPADLTSLRQALEAAVERQLMSDVPYGVLLSGGLDSSLLTAIAHRFAKRRIEDGGASEAWGPQLHRFALGLDGASDLARFRADVDADAVHRVRREGPERDDPVRDPRVRRRHTGQGAEPDRRRSARRS